MERESNEEKLIGQGKWRNIMKANENNRVDKRKKITWSSKKKMKKKKFGSKKNGKAKI